MDFFYRWHSWFFKNEAFHIFKIRLFCVNVYNMIHNIYHKKTLELSTLFPKILWNFHNSPPSDARNSSIADTKPAICSSAVPLLRGGSSQLRWACRWARPPGDPSASKPPRHPHTGRRPPGIGRRRPGRKHSLPIRRRNRHPTGCPPPGRVRSSRPAQSPLRRSASLRRGPSPIVRLFWSASRPGGPPRSTKPKRRSFTGTA